MPGASPLVDQQQHEAFESDAASMSDREGVLSASSILDQYAYDTEPLSSSVPSNHDIGSYREPRRLDTQRPVEEAVPPESDAKHRRTDTVTLANISGSGVRPGDSRAESSQPRARDDAAFSTIGPTHSSFPQALSNQPSRQSSSDSLQDAYSMLKTGVGSPRATNHSTDQVAAAARSTDLDDAGSDGSHYDDDDSVERNVAEEKVGPEMVGAYRYVDSQAPGRRHSGGNEEFTNALDSPNVPRRRSSVYPISASRKSSSSQRSTLAGKASPNEQPTVATPTFSTHSHRREVSITGELPKPLNAAGAEPFPAADSTDESISPRLQAEMEKQMTMPTDSGRPRTLKEARALAKERAKQRKGAKGASDSVVSPPAAQNQDEDPVNLTEISGQSAHAPLSHVVTAGGEAREGVGEMSDLQAAVGEALENVSFTSSTATASSSATYMKPSPAKELVGEARLLEEMQPRSSPRQNHPDFDNESNTGASITSSAFDSARESPIPRSSFTNSRGFDPRAAAVADVSIDPADVARPQQQEKAEAPRAGVSSEPHVIKTSAVLGGTESSPSAQSTHPGQFVPHTLQAQQRLTAPNKIARLDVYGKTVRWPPAFDPSAIIEQRRLAPWERARSYAHYCNDLCTTSSGLQVWLEMVQRPAQRVTNVEAKGPSTTQHSRGDGTDHSGYASSVRSNMTFPMRGDGGRAKELISQPPSEATINESHVDHLPNNLPYPLLASKQAQQAQQPQPPAHLSHQHSASLRANLLSRQQSPQNEISSGNSSSNAMSADRQPSRNFFQNLGRRGSVRKTGGSGSMSISPLAAANSRNAALSPVVSAVRSKGISLPTSVSQPSFHAMQTETLPLSPPQISPTFAPTGASTQAQTQDSISPKMTFSASMANTRSSPMGPRPPGGSFNSSVVSRQDSQGNNADDQLSVSRLQAGGTPTETSARVTSAETAFRRGSSPKTLNASLPSLANNSGKSSLSYGSVRDGRRPSRVSAETPRGDHRATLSAGMHGSTGNRRPSSGSRRSSSTAATTTGAAASPAVPTSSAAEDEMLEKLSDVLPDADRATLLTYLRQAGGNDLVAIGDYLQDRSKREQSKYLR